MSRALTRAARSDWESALAGFRDAEQELAGAAAALDACQCDADSIDDAEQRILTRRIAAIRSTVARVHSGASVTSKWWRCFSDTIPGLSPYHAAGVLELFTPLTVGALNTASSIMRVISAQVVDFLAGLRERRAV
jgi:hypothetical protein